MKYDNAEDANLYLQGSYVKYKGRPIKVERVVNDVVDEEVVIRVIFDDIMNETMHTCQVEDLDLSPFKLGYVYDNQNRRSIYTQRVPSRNFRQGLTSRNVEMLGQGHFEINHMSRGFIIRMLRNRYPTVFKAYRIAKRDRAEVPFSRTSTVDRYGVVRYKTKTVGEWTGSKFNILSRFSYLRETYKEYEHAYIRHY